MANQGFKKAEILINIFSTTEAILINKCKKGIKPKLLQHVGF